MTARNDLTHNYTKNGDQYDWCARFRHYVKWGSGIGKYIKRTLNKRARRAVKAELHDLSTD